MKAYLDFNDFTKMVDIPHPWSEFVLPIRNNAQLITECNPADVDVLPTLTFIRIGEINTDTETIIKYRWDGKLPGVKK